MNIKISHFPAHDTDENKRRLINYAAKRVAFVQASFLYLHG